MPLAAIRYQIFRDQADDYWIIPLRNSRVFVDVAAERVCLRA